MPHPGEDKAVKCPTNVREGGRLRALGIDGAISAGRVVAVLFGANITRTTVFISISMSSKISSDQNVQDYDNFRKIRSFC